MAIYPIKAIYDSTGTTVTGLGEFTSGETLALDTLPVGTGATQVAYGNHDHDTVYLKKPTSAGLVKIDSSGVPSSATKGTDYVEPGTASDFTKPQRPSIQTAAVAASGTVIWAVDSQVLHITSTGNYTLTLPTVTTAMEGRSYRLVVTGAGTMTLSGSVKWQGGAPTLTNNTSKLDIFTFEVGMLSGSPYLVETGRIMNVG